MSAGSVTRALTRSLLVGLTMLWLLGVVGSGFVLNRMVSERSDHELQESGVMLMSLVRYSDDLLVTAAMLGEHRTPHEHRNPNDRFAYLIRDSAGHVLLQSADVTPDLLTSPLTLGFANRGEWRVATLQDETNGRYIQLADPLDERNDALLSAMLWLTLPLAVLLAFAAFIVFRASSQLVHQVQRTAFAVSRQDPQSLGMLPLDSVVTEMRPAVEATNRLLGRLSDALESERSFTYNSAHELRTPIAGALAQAQLLAAMADGTELRPPAEKLVGALTRLTRLAERLLALARAEGAQPLTDDWIDLGQVVRLTVGEFERDPRLRGRKLVGEIAPARVQGDLDAIGLAVRNLVENALVHGAGATTIRVKCGRTRGNTVLAVIDDGRGAGVANVQALIKRFARSAAAVGAGTGLGLSIADTLTRRMGAELRLFSPAAGETTGFEARIVWRGPAT